MPFANNNGVKIHYEVEGQVPPLLLGHGWSNTWECWHRAGFAQELNKNYRLIMLDARGHGTSDKTYDEKAYDYKFMVSDLVAILDDLKIEKTNYFGYSMGGMVGFRITLYAPERFCSLILGGAAYPIIGTEDAAGGIASQRNLEKAFREVPENPMEAYIAEMERQSGPIPPASRAFILANDARALLASIRALRGMKSPKADDLLPNIKLHSFVFAGEVDPVFSKARESANRMPNATFFSLPGIDHIQGEERSDLTLPHIKKFLAEVNI